MKRWGRLTVAVLLAAWLAGCLLRVVGRLPGPWWLWAAPYEGLLAWVAGRGVGLALSGRLAGRLEAFHRWQDRRDDERVRQAMLRSLEDDFLRSKRLSRRSEIPDRPPTVTIILPPRPPQPNRRHRSRP